METSPETDVQPVESRLLDSAYRRSGLSAGALAEATGLSIGSVRNALAGARYRDGELRQAIPSDKTVAKLAAALGVTPEALNGVGRERAAAILAEGEGIALSSSPDLESAAAIAGRQSVVRQMLAILSTEELRAELDRREESAQEQQDRIDIAEEWRMTR